MGYYFTARDATLMERIVGKRCARCWRNAVSPGLIIGECVVFVGNDDKKCYCGKCQHEITGDKLRAESERLKVSKEKEATEKVEKFEAEVARMTNTDEITSKLSAMYNGSDRRITGAKVFEERASGVVVYECVTLSKYGEGMSYAVTSKPRNLKSTITMDLDWAARMVGVIEEMDIDLNSCTPEGYKEKLKHLRFDYCLKHPSSESFDAKKYDALNYITYMCPSI